MQNWHFVVLTDPAQRSALAALYRKSTRTPGGQEDILNRFVAAAADEEAAAAPRGLGTVLTTLHLAFEREAAAVLGIPYEQVMQVGLVPVAYTVGTNFKPAVRKPLTSVVHWDRW
jgi:nitroreductase